MRSVDPPAGLVDLLGRVVGLPRQGQEVGLGGRQLEQVAQLCGLVDWADFARRAVAIPWFFQPSPRPVGSLDSAQQTMLPQADDLREGLMIDQVVTCPRVRARLRGSTFGGVLDEYVKQLQTRGYARSTIRNSLGAVEHFGSWLRDQGLAPSAVSRDLVHPFLHGHLPRCRCAPPSSAEVRLVRPALNYLLRLVRAQEPPGGRAGARLRSPSGPTSPDCTEAIAAVLDAYRSHLRGAHGLADATARSRTYFARKLLERTSGRGPLRWGGLTPGDVTAFVVDYAKRWRPTSAGVVAASLRGFLRYLQARGWCDPVLVAAVPRLPRWRLSQLPRVLSEEQLDAFLAAFDRSTATGRRDYAMALCQADLGLRACEVAALRLEDLDWRSAALRVPAGKVGRERELPLAARAGRAVADYLRRGRPATRSRHVFVRHRPLCGTPVNTAVIQTAMRRAYAQVPGCEGWAGTHALRHTAATRLHRRGARLKEVADLLGHRSLDTTAVYTKVDLPRLAAVALPWPEAKS
jgi:integrase/recombinase XerD